MKAFEYIYSQSINKAHGQYNIFIMVRKRYQIQFFYHVLFNMILGKQLNFKNGLCVYAACVFITCNHRIGCIESCFLFYITINIKIIITLIIVLCLSSLFSSVFKISHNFKKRKHKQVNLCIHNKKYILVLLFCIVFKYFPEFFIHIQSLMLIPSRSQFA